MPDVLREWVRDRLEQLAVPIDQPRHLIAVRVQGQVIRLRILRRDLLLPDPQASRSVGHHGQRVGIHARRFEHPGRLRHRASEWRRVRCRHRRRGPPDLAPHRLAAPAQSPSKLMFSARPAARNSLRFMLMASPHRVLRFRGNVLLDLKAGPYTTMRPRMFGVPHVRRLEPEYDLARDSGRAQTCGVTGSVRGRIHPTDRRFAIRRELSNSTSKVSLFRDPTLPSTARCF